ncbi:MAG TPA: AbrB/MazE/SpoVT family DNA-binding domain-containing protein [Actinophytocola sp.]|uniref:AbrB/MazE/SpoVT family DNA-binding domain-containing protein n=1 Tax=Actinophytocola sp. TaxID=1872138 RepID=UPI002DDD696D|nr:AbrB/MazE/SpoVT family DNA-binding domain-containing protein [Actinophytocola sp.]HEV2780215.1 AbrB/MazE/SpoVT family DNA-binding domain-containing protein [Actinophytocola sp.]
MSASLINSVVPALLPRSGGRAAGDSAVPSLVRGPLPLPSLISDRTSNLVYGLAALDDRGRVADRIVMRALGWYAGLRLAIEETGGVLTVRADPTGAYQVTGQRHLRLPAPLRHRCGLAAGDRVLLAADPDRSRLAIYPPAALDNALAQYTDGGEPA